MSNIPEGLWATISTEPMPKDVDYEAFRYIRRKKWDKENKDFEIEQLKFFLAFKKRTKSKETKRLVDEIIKQLMGV